jgi:hypothetical protein
MSDTYWCPITVAYCTDDCYSCLEFLTSCDRCYVGGHTDSGGFKGYLVGPGSIRCLCLNCYEIEGGESKEDLQEKIWNNV